MTMRRILGLAALALAPLTAVPAQAADPTSYTLDNGLQVLVLEDHRAPVVVQMVYYKIGAADEPPGHSGIAHFLEHLLFQGTENMAAGELSQTVSRNGGSDNAFTSWDQTAYFQRVAADRLELMMRMESDRMRNLKLTEDDVRTERQVILEERNQRIDSDPGALFNEQMRAALYLNSPYQIPVIGWRHEMEALTRQDAYDFYKKYYAPNNAILIVAGDVQPEEVLKLAKTYYGPLEPTPGLGERTRPQEPPQLAERRLKMVDPRVAQPYLVRNYVVPERDHDDQRTAAALTMLAELLGGNAATSVLGQKLQFDSHVAVYASAYYSGVSYDDTTFGYVVVPSEGVSLAEAEAALDKAVDEFLAEGIDDAQWERIRFQLRASQVYADDDIGSQARTYGSALTSGLTIEDVQAWPDILQSVTKDEVMAAARDLLDRRHSVTGWLSPTEQKDAVQ
ncbi:M16 family metallopeptidase [Frigidibacter sp. ROC022]|uniref:M16 family metallopeptidase n=1 Tax=Frigidibacter sp. ROC022 TaxID=2971796 RepID=UPI00215AE28A|nr:pitrilysin family protein [Frigidibacter sp. ROC022]MCR8724882.1 insulinase family protein [Frigidibacter sp. ROC022]